MIMGKNKRRMQLEEEMNKNNSMSDVMIDIMNNENTFSQEEEIINEKLIESPYRKITKEEYNNEPDPIVSPRSRKKIHIESEKNDNFGLVLAGSAVLVSTIVVIKFIKEFKS